MDGILTRIAVGGVLAIAAACGSTAVKADQTPPKQAREDASAVGSAAVRLSEDGYRAARAIRLARLEIFNGQPGEAGSMLKLASDALAAAEREANQASRGMEPRGKANSGRSDQLWIPVDGQISLSDDFVATPERERHIDAANRHLKRGDKARALEEFRLAEVDVVLTRILMPLAATRNHVASAERLIAEGKLYEANLALKAAEDSMVTDTEMLIERPAAGPR